MWIHPSIPLASIVVALTTSGYGQPVDAPKHIEPKVAAPAAAAPSVAVPSVIEFRGVIDGSERIEITASGATWHNVDRHLPGSPMMVNGHAWNPGGNRTLDNGGETKFLARSVDFSQARLEVIQARDSVAMTHTDDGIMLYLNDTPNGAGRYHFRVHFTPPRPATLRIKARIDGSDVLHITQTSATWEHKHWKRPAAVTINGRDWDPARQPTLPNSGETAFLRHAVDFSTARVVHKDGRDMAVVVPAGDGVKLHFADNPNGADDYELIVAFGQR